MDLTFSGGNLPFLKWRRAAGGKPLMVDLWDTLCCRLSRWTNWKLNMFNQREKQVSSACWLTPVRKPSWRLSIWGLISSPFCYSRKVFKLFSLLLKNKTPFVICMWRKQLRTPLIRYNQRSCVTVRDAVEQTGNKHQRQDKKKTRASLAVSVRNQSEIKDQSVFHRSSVVESWLQYLGFE